jgi:ribosomal protein S18 acetylase RimI-like enzyme
MSNVASLVIRPMREADVEPLAAALAWPAQVIQRRWLELTQGLRAVFVAEADRSPLGAVSINQHQDFPGLLHLFALDVALAWRRRGIGSELMRSVEAEARRQGLSGVYLEVSVDNHGAIRLYERSGYVREGEQFLNKWVDYRVDGPPVESQEICHRMFKRFGPEQP